MPAAVLFRSIVPAQARVPAQRAIRSADEETAKDRLIQRRPNRVAVLDYQLVLRFSQIRRKWSRRKLSA